MKKTQEKPELKSSEQNQPNWVDRWRLYLEYGRTILIIFTVGIVAWKYVAHEKKKLELEEQQLESEVRAQQEPIVELTGQILAPKRFVPVGNKSIAIAPLVIRVSNPGVPPIEVGQIEFKFFRGQASEVIRLEQRQPSSSEPEKTINLTVYESGNRTDSPAGIIDLESPNWKEIPELRKSATLANCKIFHDQERQHTFHVALPSGRPDEIHRVSVTVFPANDDSWSALTWSGFTDPSYCAPSAFPAALESAPSAPPPGTPSP